jgi:hypothetical protein
MLSNGKVELNCLIHSHPRFLHCHAANRGHDWPDRVFNFCPSITTCDSDPKSSPHSQSGFVRVGYADFGACNWLTSSR